MDKNTFFARTKKTRPVALDDGTTLHVKKLSQGEVEQMRREYSDADKQAAGLRYVVCKCVTDEQGVRVFADSDLAKLAEMDFEEVQHIAAEVLEFSGLAPKSEKKD